MKDKAVVGIVIAIIVILLLLWVCCSHEMGSKKNCKCARCGKCKCPPGQGNPEKCRCDKPGKPKLVPRKKQAPRENFITGAGDIDSNPSLNPLEFAPTKDEGLNPGCEKSWSEYISDTFIEPEVHESHLRYATEAIDRSRNPSKFSVIDGPTDDSARFTGFSRPRRVQISSDAQLVPDVDVTIYRDPIAVESTQGFLEAHFGYNV